MFTSSGFYNPCGLFNLSHIVASFICIALVLICVYLAKDMKKQEFKPYHIFLIVVLGLMLVVDIVWSIIQKQITIENLFPYGLILSFIIALCLTNARNGNIKQLAKIFIAYVGVAFGLLILVAPVPSFTNYPLFHFKSMFAILSGSIIFFLGLMQFVFKQVEMNSKTLGLAIFLVFDLIIDCLILNVVFNANYLYLFNPGNLNVEWLSNIYLFNNNIYTALMVVLYIMPILVIYTVYKLADLLVKRYNKN